MESFIYAFIGLFGGGILSYLISKRFYDKSIKNYILTCEVEYISEFFSNLYPSLKKDLLINYKGAKVEDLYIIKFIIKNAGHYSIKDVIHPLTLAIPDKGVIVDLKIEEPSEGRKIKSRIFQFEDESSVELSFELLNPNEYFKLELLINGRPPIQRVSFPFSITAEGLPAKITSKWYIKSEVPKYTFKKWFDSSLFIIIPLFLIGSLGYLLYFIDDVNPELCVRSGHFFREFSLMKLSVLILWIVLHLLLYLMVIFLISLFSSKKRGH